MKDLSKRLEALTPAQRALFELALERRKTEALDRQEARKPLSAVGIPRRKPAPYDPLTIDQERIYFLHTMNPTSPFYNVYAVTRFRGDLRVEVLRQALNEVVRRHEILRTTFHMVDGQAVQIMHETPRVEFPVVDLRAIEDDRRENEAKRLFNGSLKMSFAVDRLLLFRTFLIQVADDEHICPFTMHHLIMDWVTFYALFTELVKVYEAFKEGRPSPLPEPRLQFADYAVWQREVLTDEVWTEQLEYWTEKLADAPHVTEMPADFQRLPVERGRGARRKLALPKSDSDVLRAMASREQASLFMILLATFKLLIYRLGEQDRIIVGSPVANLNQAELQGVMGFFMNQLVFYTDLSGEPSFVETLRRVRETAIGAYAHQDVPFGRLVETLEIERDLSRVPLTQLVLLFLNPTQFDYPQVGGLELLPCDFDGESAKFDINFSLWDDPSGFSGWMEGSTDLFERSTLQRFNEAYVALVHAAVAEPDRPISQLALLGPRHQQQLLTEWNTGEDFWQEPSGNLFGLLVLQARATPHRVAIDAESAGQASVQVSFEALERRARTIAQHLRTSGIGQDQLIAICGRRTPELVAALWGIWGAGAAYMPLDPSYPSERLTYMLEAGGAVAVLTERALLGDLPETTLPVLTFEDLERHPAGNAAPLSPGSASLLAYTLFTSGSTGRPKGVMISRRAVRWFLDWTRTLFTDEDLEGVLASTSISFDISVFEFFLPLVSGGRLLLVQNGLDVPAMAAPERIRTLNTVPSVLRELEAIGALNPSIRTVNSAGEALSRDLATRILNRGVGRLFNLYGPTEATVYCTYAAVDTATSPDVPIGRPVDGMRVRILDRFGRLAWRGSVGELCFGGAALSRGYRRRPALTAERFIPDAYSGPGQRLYRTGDRARWRADGQLEFHGRFDHQVKVRGFRIELGEIESVLELHPDVSEAAVLVQRSGGRPGLAAYVVAPEGVEAPSLRSHLRRTLPDYMMPAVFFALEAMPTAATRKIDRKALAKIHVPPLAEDAHGPEFTEAARNPTEEILAEIWASVLNVPQVGIHDNFFAAGGDSILSMQVAFQAAQRGLQFNHGDLFRFQTVASLAAMLDSSDGAVQSVAPPLEAMTSAAFSQAGAENVSPAPEFLTDTPRQRFEDGTPFPLTPIQRWFLDGEPHAPHHYNQAMLFEVRRPLDPDRLRQAAAVIEARHDALRLRFERTVDGWRQRVATSDFAIPCLSVDVSTPRPDGRQRVLEQVVAWAHRRLDLENGPLWRLVWFDYGGLRSGRLLIVIHHLAVDGVSWRILLEELMTAYRGEALTAPPIGFEDWARTLRQASTADAIRAEEAFWQDMLTPAVAALPPHTSERAARNTVRERGLISREWSAPRTRALLQDAPSRCQARVGEILIAALVLALGRVTGEQRWQIDLETHGRDAIAPGLDPSRTVGWLTAIHPIVLEADLGDRGVTVTQVRDRLRTIPRGGLGFGLLTRGGAQAGAETLRRLGERSEIVFNYLGRLDGALASNAELAPAKEGTGSGRDLDAERSHRLEIDAVISRGRLRTTWAFSQGLDDRASVESWLEMFLEVLDDIVGDGPPDGGAKTLPTPTPEPPAPKPTLKSLRSASMSAGAKPGQPVKAAQSATGSPSTVTSPSTSQSTVTSQSTMTSQSTGVQQAEPTWQDEARELIARVPGLTDAYPLSPMQAGMLAEHLFAGKAGPLFQQMTGFLNGPLDVANFRTAWQRVIDRHPILRTAFFWQGLSRPLQGVYTTVDLPFAVLDWKERAEATQEADLEAFQQADRDQDLPLDRPPLLRVTLIALAPDRHAVVWSHHHILLDGWSLPRVLGEVFEFYRMGLMGVPVPTISGPPFRSFIEWLETRDLDTSREFWRQRLASIDSATPLGMADRRPEASASGSAGRQPGFHEVEWPLLPIRHLAREQHVTLTTVMAAAWAVLLAAYAERDDVTFGLTTSGRPPELAEAFDMLGVFINTLPLPLHLERSMPVSTWLTEVQNIQVDLRAHEYVPLVDIREQSSIPSNEPIFESILVFENYPIDHLTQASSATPGQLRIDEVRTVEQSPVPLTLTVMDMGDTLRIRAPYDRRLFEDATVQRVLKQLGRLLERMAADPNQSLAELDPLGTNETSDAPTAEGSANQGSFPPNPGLETDDHTPYSVPTSDDPTPEKATLEEATLEEATLEETFPEEQEPEETQPSEEPPLETHRADDRPPREEEPPAQHRTEELEPAVAKTTRPAISSDAAQALIACLRDHPRVVDCSVTNRATGPDPRWVVHVQPTAQEFATAQTEILAEWRDVFDDLYRRPSPRDPLFDTLGWNNSYTGDPLPEADMRQCFDDAAEQILALRPKRILEIGCGSGPLFFRLAPEVERYCGTDHSTAALSRVERHLSKLGLAHDRVRLEQRDADDFERLPKGFFDLIVLHSVSQYLPGRDDLIRVLDQALEWVADGGHIVIGDVRNRTLRHAFYTSLELYKGSPDQDAGALRRAVERRRYQETEMWIDPAFFADYADGSDRVARLGVHPKGGAIDNELTAFRYHAILEKGSINERASERSEGRSWTDEEWTLERLKSHLENDRPDALCLTGIPNSRTSAAVKASDWLAKAEDTIPVHTLLNQLGEDGEAIDPHAVQEVARAAGYATALGWGHPGRDGRFDLALSRGSESPTEQLPAVAITGEPTAWVHQPVTARLTRALMPELEAWIAERLPEYPKPAAYATVESMDVETDDAYGLMSCTDIDIRDRSTPRILPRNAVEERLAQIWREVLALPEVGIQDDFFSLGGASAQLAQVATRIRQFFGVEMPLRDLTERPTIKALIPQLERLREEAPHAPSLPAPTLGLRDDARFYNLLAEASESAQTERWPDAKQSQEARLRRIWNDTSTPYPRQTNVPELVLEWVQRTPNAVAVIDGPARLTYSELDRRSRALAQALASGGMQPEAPVILALTRSSELVVAMLGVLRAGGVYVPIDSSYPAARIRFILRDTEARIALTDDNFQPLVQAASEDLPSPPASLRVRELVRLSLPDEPALDTASQQLAYIMYTSGSTGAPKGVGIPHRAIVRLVRQTNYFRAVPTDRFAQVSNAAFDASTFEIWGALLNGASLVILQRDTVLSPPLLADAIDRHRLDILFLTTSLFHQLVSEIPGAFGRLYHLLVGGEAMDPARARTLLEHGGPRHLLNGYGPTESTTFASWWTVKSVPVDATSIPIGRPLSNTELYIADPDLQPAAFGAPGELLIGGDGLARGYVRRAALTAERFVPDALGERSGDRLYRTGDRARRRESGAIEFLGRLDHQIKLRGFRVELGEIEAILRTHPAIEEAAVLLDGEGAARHLVAFISAETVNPQFTEECTAFLAERLPEFMVPSVRITGSLPLNANGKVDRAHLKTMLETASPPAPVSTTTPAQDGIAAQLAEIWCQVLRRDAVHAEDDFFALGGQSLLGIQVISRVRDVWNVDLPFAQLFDTPTLAGMAAALEQALGDDPSESDEPLEPRDGDGDAALSFAQERLWFLHQLEPESPVYNIGVALELVGTLRVAALRQALEALTQRHEILRSHFVEADGQPRSRIDKNATAPWQEIDLSTAADASEAAHAHRVQERTQPFDLASGPLWRVLLIRLGATRHQLVLTLHHTIADGWSLGVLVQDLTTLYRAADPRSADAAASLQPLTVQYADYADWQHRTLSGEPLGGALEFWRQTLDGVPVLDLPIDRPRFVRQSGRGAARLRVLPPRLMEKLDAVERRHGVTRFMILQAAFQCLLARHGDCQDVAIGTPVAGRSMAKIEPLIGLFVNTLVLRLRLQDDPTVAEVLERVRQNTVAAFEHQNLPFERLVLELQPERDLGQNPLFQAMFSMQDMPIPPLELPGLELRPIPSDVQTAMFDLTLTIEGDGANCLAWIEYSRDLFDAVTIERLGRHYEQLLNGLAEDPTRKVLQLPLGSAAERHLLRTERNDRPETSTLFGLDDLLTMQALRRAQAIALICGEDFLSYGELARRARSLAQQLRIAGVGRETSIALILERSIDVPWAMLGVLEAGAAFLPIHPETPDRRREAILRDARIAWTIRRDAEPSVWPTIDLAAWRSLPGNPRTSVPPQAAAYTIYTSGSTGTPKGVVVSRAAIESHCQATVRWLDLDDRDRVLAMAPFSSDVALEQILPPLFAGATVVLTWDDPWLPSDPAQEFDRKRITVADLPAAWFKHWMANLSSGQVSSRTPSTLRAVSVGGEALPVAAAKSWLESTFRPIALHNAYGPTEATITASTARLQATPEWRAPIGRTLGDRELFVVDRHLRLAPLGAPGQLAIGGPLLARGYLRRPLETARVFVPNPWSSGTTETRLYLTGDRVRILADGQLDILGRIDRQLEIRGFRIEPEEIESLLMEHPDVEQALVLAQEAPSGDLSLVAYIQGPASLGTGTMLEHLHDRLPAVMIPGAFVRLDDWPRTANGALDRAALPAPGDRRGREQLAPRTATEERLLALWQQVLERQEIGVEDDFFRLGGHSLLATQVIARVRQDFGVDLPLRDMFAASTIAAMAQAVDKALAEQSSDAPEIQRISRRDRRMRRSDLDR